MADDGRGSRFVLAHSYTEHWAIVKTKLPVYPSCIKTKEILPTLQPQEVSFGPACAGSMGSLSAKSAGGRLVNARLHQIMNVKRMLCQLSGYI